MNLKVFYKFYNSIVLSEQNFAYDKVLLPHTKCVSRNEFGDKVVLRSRRKATLRKQSQCNFEVMNRLNKEQSFETLTGRNKKTIKGPRHSNKQEMDREMGLKLSKIWVAG